MAGHAQLKFVMTECSKTQIRLTGLILLPYFGVGGNAMDLQRMNENLMSKKCPMEVCQSVCMVKNATTGCFTCNPYCGAAGGTGMIGSPNMQGL